MRTDVGRPTTPQRTKRRAPALLLVAASLFAGTALAQPADTVDAATKRAVQAVISAQLDAFVRDDAARAESFAAPEIRRRYPEPRSFLDMVRRNYAVLLHPKSTQFDEIAASPHGPVQRMTVVDQDGLVWRVIYALAPAEGSWRIIGCVVQRDENQQAI